MEEFSQEQEEQGHSGGAWKVAYADFVTALMALFIVLWLMNTRQDVRSTVSAYFRDPKGFAALVGSGHAGSGEGLAVDKGNVAGLRTRLQQAMHDLPGFGEFSDHVLFTVAAEGLRVELLEKEDGLFFETGSPRPTEKGQQLFSLMAAQLKDLPNPIIIEGHTDARPFRSQELEAYGNWELSFDRANMARRAMVASGVRAAQVSEIRGYAANRLLINSAPEDSRNRRVSIVIDISTRPGKTASANGSQPAGQAQVPVASGH